MPNRHDALVVKLISIGISQDLTFIEHIKYTKVGNELKWTEEDFVASYRKIFMALITLAFILNDYELRRLCVQAASACEPKTKFSAAILKSLPCSRSSISEANPEYQQALLQLREILESFQSAIKMEISLPSTWQKASIVCYENLDFFNRRIRLSEDLKPLEYPGIEKRLKRPRADSSEEVKETEKKDLDFKKILSESKEFALDISNRFKQLKNSYNSTLFSEITPPLASEIQAIICNEIRHSPDFEIEDGKILMKISEEMCLEASRNYHIKWFWIDTERKKMNKADLFFDFNMEPRDLKDIEVGTMYHEGIVPVYDLSQRSFTMFDIENVMLFTIMEKKRLFIKQEFIELNRNKGVEQTNEQSHHAFNYLICRAPPEHGRLLRIQSAGLTSSSVYEYCLENYTFDAIPGRYKYTKKHADTGESPGETNVNPLTKPEKVPKVSRTTPSKVTVAKLPVDQKPGPACKAMTKKEERAQSGFLPATETFKASEEFLGILDLLANELSIVAGSKVSLDLKKLSDESSPHIFELTYKGSTLMNIKATKKRNNISFPPTQYKFDLPARIHGSLNIETEWKDTVIYDVNFEPQLKSVALKSSISGSITFDHVSINVKDIEIECTLHGLKSSFKLGLRMGSRSRHKTELSRNSRDGIKFLSESNSNSSRVSTPKLLPANTVELPVQVKAEATSHNFDSPVVDSSQTSHHETPEQVVTSMTPESSTSVVAYTVPVSTYQAQINICEQNYQHTDSNNDRPSIIHQTEPSYSFHMNGSFSEEVLRKIKIEDETKEVTTIAPTIEEMQTAISIIKTEASCEEIQFEAVSSSSQSLPDLSNQIIPKIEKCQILKVEHVSPKNLANNQSNGCGDTSPMDNQEVLNTKTKVNGQKIKREKKSHATYAAPVGGTLDDFEELLSDSAHFVKTGPPIIVPVSNSPHEPTPPKSPPPLHYPECYNRRVLDPLRKSVEFKTEPIDLSADRIMSHTPPEDVIDLTEDTDESYSIKRAKPCPRSKKLVKTNNYQFCKDIFSMHEDQSKLKEQYSRVLKKVEAKNKNSENSCNLKDIPKSKVYLIDVLTHIDQSQPKSDIKVKVEAVRTKLKPNVSSFSYYL